MVNALANHGYLPRDGLNVSLDEFITAINQVLHFSPDFTRHIIEVQQPASTTGYPNTLHLNDLDKHGSKYDS